MQSKENAPKRPLTPFFVYRDKVREDGKMIGTRESAAKWKALTEEEKKPYLDEYKKTKEIYMKYLEEVEGIKPRGSSSPKKKQKLKYKTNRIRAICGVKKEIKPLQATVPAALGKVMVKLSKTS